MRISDWSSDVCSSDLEGQPPSPVTELLGRERQAKQQEQAVGRDEAHRRSKLRKHAEAGAPAGRRILHRQKRSPAPFPAQAQALAEAQDAQQRSEEHTSELQSLMRISYAVFCLKKNTTK